MQNGLEHGHHGQPEGLVPKAIAEVAHLLEDLDGEIVDRIEISR